jgi:hypothetical protein
MQMSIFGERSVTPNAIDGNTDQLCSVLLKLG